ncbi:Abi family protein [Oceanivirga salmonicida]|uniref:Abi family protein n=1 Tax=Oceanivirga salmonicida TaxID=1769291 RepID=UPI0008296263|nr:Abi family protein [Oceanivirga salmonicida]
MKKEIHLTYKEQLELLKSRGMIINDDIKALKTLRHINYYKLKDFSQFFIDKNNMYKKETYFDAVVKNFYLDKELRLELLSLIEIIELSIKNKLAYQMGKRFGAVGYLDFSRWCNEKISINEKNKYQKELIVKIKDRIKYENEDYKTNNGMPNIWKLVEILTFGEILFLFDLMKIKDKKMISGEYNMKISHFISQIKHLNLIRNFCAHNRPIINKKIITIPYIQDEIKFNILLDDKRIVVSILITVHWIRKIDENFNFDKLYSILNKLIRYDNVAKKYGIKNKKIILDYIKNI